MTSSEICCLIGQTCLAVALIIHVRISDRREKEANWKINVLSNLMRANHLDIVASKAKDIKSEDYIVGIWP